MRKRLILSAMVMLAITGIALATLAMLPSGPGVTKANFDRIKKGITLAEVEAIFGEKATWGNESPQDGMVWIADDLSTAYVVFDVDGKVDDEASWNMAHEPILDKIRRWLHLP